MSVNILPDWMNNLEDEDIVFIKKFLLSSGSLKEVANYYNVTYPTVRLRLDRIIQKIQMVEENNSDPFIVLVKKLALDEKIDFETAKIIMAEYKKSKKVGK